MVTKRQKLEEKETRILAAARDVFVEFGFEKGRMAEIAKRAGVAEGTVYLYYQTKKDLVRAVLEQYWARLTREALEALPEGSNTFDQLQAFARFHLSAFHRDIDYINMNVAARTAHQDFEVPMERVRDYVRVFDQLFERGKDRGEIRTTVPTWVARDMFFGTLEHTARSTLSDDNKDPEAATANLIALFQAGYTDEAPEKTAELAPLVQRLEAAVARLDDLTSS
ncbi:MAG: TetR family transcriptional regulator [Rhodobacteraceae bacterium]|nr:TetR family transcriptional regulator [Paracoccaceae bacterium]